MKIEKCLSGAGGLLMMLSVVACDRPDEFSPPPNPTPTPSITTSVPIDSPSASEVRQEFAEAFRATGRYTGAKAEEFQVWAREQLSEIRTDLGVLTERSARKNADAQTKDDGETSDFERRLDLAEDKLQAFAENSGEALDTAGEKLRAELSDLRQSIGNKLNQDNASATETAKVEAPPVVERSTTVSEGQIISE